ncbi:MAG: hypothetical protein HQ567_12935, partial [Candidatus Nealsonbacteria bacterium]|nr:hypothetical protein [Candidatus Nealsonbacteria bacterium]
VAIAAAAVLLGVLKQQADMLSEAPDDALYQAAAGAVRLTAIFSSIGTASFVGMGFWFWWLGRKIVRADRYPPPGMKVIRDTPVRTGAAAGRLAIAAQITGLLLAVAGTAAMWYLHRVATAMLRP